MDENLRGMAKHDDYLIIPNEDPLYNLQIEL